MSRRRTCIPRRMAPPVTPAMVGVTIVNMAYAAMGAEAAARFKWGAGLDTLIFFRGADPVHSYKLILPELLAEKRSVVFYDADWWLNQRVHETVAAWNGADAVFAVPDPGVFNPSCFVCLDCGHLGIPKERYVNTGFWCADFRNPAHRRAFQHAIELMRRRDAGLEPAATDHGEQSWLNLSFIRARCPVERLPWAWNYFESAVRAGYAPRLARHEIIGFHAAGMRSEWKRSHLKENTQPIETHAHSF